MIEPFQRGKVWFLYRKLEREFIETTSYVALETKHRRVWSEKFGELLIRIGSSVGSFFNLMIDSKSLDGQETVEELRKRIEKMGKESPTWSPNITDFRKAYNPIFNLSTVKVGASYGLTNYGELQPFKGFRRRKPNWWDAHNKLKHEFYEKLEERATLQNTIDALAGLFVLNILHKESQRYLLRYTEVIDFGVPLPKGERERAFAKSMEGLPGIWHGWKIKAETPLFIHHFRVEDSKYQRLV